MNATAIGTILEIRETKVFTDNFSVKTVIIETVGKYPKKLPIQFVNGSIVLADELNLGESYTFNVNVNGREWTKDAQSETTYFISFNCWSFNVEANDVPKRKTMGNIEHSFQEDAIRQLNNELEDDLEF